MLQNVHCRYHYRNLIDPTLRYVPSAGNFNIDSTSNQSCRKNIEKLKYTLTSNVNVQRRINVKISKFFIAS